MPPRWNRGYRNPMGLVAGASLGGILAGLDQMVRQWRASKAAQSAPPMKAAKSARKGKGKGKAKAKKSKSLASQVKSLQRQMANQTATLIYKDRQVDVVKVDAYNECELASTSGSSINRLETVLGQLRYFNPATPGTYTTVDFTSGAQVKSVRVSMYSKCVLRNNYVVPAKVTLYCVVPRVDTSISSANAYINGIADIGTSIDPDNIQMYPTDVPQFNDLWTIVRKSTRMLQAGQQMRLAHSVKPFDYDPSLNDSHNTTYQKQFGAHQYLVRVEGPLSHDSSSAVQQGYQKAAVDLCVDTIYTVKYPGGADIKYFVTASNASSFTNTPNVSSLDVAQETYAL